MPRNTPRAEPFTRAQEIVKEARGMSIEVLKYRRRHWTSLARMYKRWGIQHVAASVAAIYSKEIKRRKARGT